MPQIVADTQYNSTNGNIDVALKFLKGINIILGNITWKGNAKYSTQSLLSYWASTKVTVYNIGTLNKKLGKELSP
jgi:outer membrane protein insertion porin family